MSVEVTLKNNSKHEFATGTTWHVDDHHVLHVKNASKQAVASFAANDWLLVKQK